MNDHSGGNRGYGQNYPQNNGQQGQYPSSGNNMQYNYTMNQPYNNMGYPEQYYPPQDPYQQNYPQGSYEEDDYDNLDEIERVSVSCCHATFYLRLISMVQSVNFIRSSARASPTITSGKWPRPST